jgi:hypothetical protein
MLHPGRRLLHLLGLHSQDQETCVNPRMHIHGHAHDDTVSPSFHSLQIISATQVYVRTRENIIMRIWILEWQIYISIQGWPNFTYASQKSKTIYLEVICILYSENGEFEPNSCAWRGPIAVQFYTRISSNPEKSSEMWSRANNHYKWSPQNHVFSRMILMEMETVL